MADLSSEQMAALNRFLGTLTNSAGAVSRGMNDLNDVVNRRVRAEKADALLVDKMSKSKKVYIDRIAEMNKTLSGANSKMSIFAGSIHLADKGFNKLLTSSDVTADYLQNRFPKEIEKGLSSFVSKTGVAINDFRDVMRLQDISSETKRLVEGFADGTRTQYHHVKEYMDLLGDAGTSITKMAGMSGIAAAEFKDLTNKVEQARKGTVERDQAEAAVSKFVVSNQDKLAKSAIKLSATLAEVADESNHRSKFVAAHWDAVEAQGKFGKLIGTHMRPGGGGIPTALRALEISAVSASYNLVRSFGSKAMTELMDMARTGMQKGVEPFPKIAAQLRMSGKDYQEIMATNKQAVASSIGGYTTFNDLMIKHNAEYMDITGKDPVLAGKTAAGAITLMKSFSGAAMTTKEVSSGMTDISQDMGKMRDIFGMTAQDTLEMNKRIMESAGIQENIIRMNKEERAALRTSINARVEEYGLMGLSAKKAEELVTLTQKALGIKSPKDIVRDSMKAAQYASQVGLGGRDAQMMAALLRKRATVGLTGEEGKQLEGYANQVAKLEMSMQKRQAGMDEGGQLALQGMRSHFDQAMGVDEKRIIASQKEVEMAKGLAAQGGKALGAGKGGVMATGGTLLDVKNAIDTLNSNVTGTWAFWGAAIVGAITVSTIGTKGVKDILSKGLGGIEKMGGRTAKDLLTGTADVVKSSKTLGSIGGVLKGAASLKGGLVGAALGIGSQFLPEDSTAGKLLQSKTAQGAMWGSMLGPMGALAGGAIGGAWDLYDYATSPTAPNQTPPEMAASVQAETKKKHEDRQEKTVDINQLMLTQLQQSNMKLDNVTKTLQEGNELYAMTEEEKKALIAKRKVSTMRG